MTTTTSRRAIELAKPNRPSPDGSDSRPTQALPAPISLASDAPNSSRRANGASVTKVDPPAGSGSRSTIDGATTEVESSSGPASPAANGPTTPHGGMPQGTKAAGRRVPSDAHGTDAAGTNSGPAATADTAPNRSSLLDPALCLAADVLDDIERVRIANQNRLRQLTRTGEDADGEERGFGLDPDHPDVMRLGLMVLTLEKVEHDATLELQRKLRKHPLGAWVKAQRGVGEKQGARLLAAIGDPYINGAKDAPRTVSALWAYCGLHVLPGGHVSSDAHEPAAAGVQHGDTDPGSNDDQSFVVGVAAKRRKGERANWSTKAKTRAYLVAESCMKQLSPDCRDGHGSNGDQGCPAVPAQDQGGESTTGVGRGMAAQVCGCSPYRVIYDRRRAHTAVSRPEWTDGHSHNDALRVAAKEILKDLWRAAREWHLGRVA